MFFSQVLLLVEHVFVADDICGPFLSFFSQMLCRSFLFVTLMSATSAFYMGGLPVLSRFLSLLNVHFIVFPKCCAYRMPRLPRFSARANLPLRAARIAMRPAASRYFHMLDSYAVPSFFMNAFPNPNFFVYTKVSWYEMHRAFPSMMAARTFDMEALINQVKDSIQIPFNLALG
jgi:hypothetical protein